MQLLLEAEVLLGPAVAADAETAVAVEELRTLLLNKLPKTKTKNLTKKDQKPALMSPPMPVLATGRKAGPRLTAPTLWSAPGSTSSPLENEK